MIIKIFQKLKQERLLVFVVFMLIIVVSAVTYFYNRVQVEKSVENFNIQLQTLADLKTKQIQLWRDERIIDGQTIQNDHAFSDQIQLLSTEPDDYLVVKGIQDRLNTLFFDPNYSSIFMVDVHGNILLQVGNLDENPGDFVLEKITTNVSTHEIFLTDLYLATDDTVKMEMIVPIISSSNKAEPAQLFLVYLINPEEIFFPLLQSLPTSYQSAETLLIRKDGDSVLFLNDLRFKDDSALKLTFPLNNIDILAVMAANGVIGIVNGRDYREVSVVGSVVPVEGTNWKLIAKIDRDEIYRPIRRQVWNAIISSLFLIIAIGLVINVVWRRQSSVIYQGLSDSEKKRRGLEEKYATLFSQANDAILLVEENGRILDANNQAIKMYGYSREELLSLSVADLRDEFTKLDVTKDMDQVKEGSGNLFETIHKRKSGETFRVDVSSRYISFEGEGFFQSLVRDVTERKQGEEQLRRSELALKKAQQISHVGSWFWNCMTNIVDWSDEMNQIFGIVQGSRSKQFDELIKQSTHPDDYERIMQISTSAIKNKETFSFENRIVRPNGEERMIWVEAGELNVNENGEIISVSGIVQDITEKKLVERELQKSENLLQRIYELLPVGLWITDEEGRTIRSNKMAKEILGVEIANGEKANEIIIGRRLPSKEKIEPDDWAVVHTIKEGITIKDEMIEIDTKDGKTKTILNYTMPILSEKNEMEGAIILNLDITELKKAEEQLSTQLDELRRWNLATLGRENRIRELKKEINALLIKHGDQPRYKSVVGDAHE